MKNFILLNAAVCMLLTVFIDSPIHGQGRKPCSGGRKDCSLGPWLGGDGKAQIYKLLCCEADEGCGSALLPGQKRPDPYCIRNTKKECEWNSFGREHTDKYDPKEQCCSSQYGVLQKYPISYIGRCPNRGPRAGVKLEPNGCGTKDKPVDPTDKEDLGKGRTIGGRADFTEACNAHDSCYDTCNSDRGACDDKFLEKMNAICNATYKRGASLDHCMKMARNWFFQGVKTLGSSAYDDAQKRVCQCCPDDPVASIMDIILPPVFGLNELFFEYTYVAPGA